MSCNRRMHWFYSNFCSACSGSNHNSSKSRSTTTSRRLLIRVCEGPCQCVVWLRFWELTGGRLVKSWFCCAVAICIFICRRLREEDEECVLKVRHVRHMHIMLGGTHMACQAYTWYSIILNPQQMTCTPTSTQRHAHTTGASPPTLKLQYDCRQQKTWQRLRVHELVLSEFIYKFPYFTIHAYSSIAYQ